MKAHVNSGIGNVLEFFIHKSSRGIGSKISEVKFKKVFLLFGGFPVQSWARLVIFLCLSLLTAKQSYLCFLLEKVKNLLFQAMQNEGT